MSAFKPDGVFFACELSPQILKYMEKSEMPAIFIDIYSPLYSCNFIYVDNYQASYMLTHYLIGKGHKRIGFVGDISKTTSISDRYFGYVKAMNEAGLSVNPQWHTNQNIERVPSIPPLPLDHMPTAYNCHLRSAAKKLYTSLSVNGLRVTEDVSVVSFDNTTLSDNFDAQADLNRPAQGQHGPQSFLGHGRRHQRQTVGVQIRSHLVERDSVRTIEAASD
jgi:LacI family transcriptional regulator